MSRSFGGKSLTTRSPIRTRPSVMTSRPATMRSAVVFPQPEGPTSTTNSSFSISSPRSETARVPSGYTFVSCSSSIRATNESFPDCMLPNRGRSITDGGRRPRGPDYRQLAGPPGEPSPARHGPDRPGGHVHRRPRRRPAPSGDLPLVHERHRRLAHRRLRRDRQLQAPVVEPDLPGRAQEHLFLHARLPGDRARAREGARQLPHPGLPRQVVSALPDRPPLGGADLAGDPRLEVDLRLALQLRKLDGADPAPAGPEREPPVDGQPGPDDGCGHHRPHVAAAALRHDHHHRRALLHPARDRGRGRGRRRHRLAADALCHHPARPADHDDRAPLRDRLHGHGHGRRLPAGQQRRPVQLDAHDHDLVLHDRDPLRLPGRRRGDLALPLPHPPPRRRAHALVRTSDGGRLVLRHRTRRTLSTYLVVGPFAIVLAYPFYLMLITAFKTNRDLYDQNNNPLIFNDAPTFANIDFLFTETQYVRWLVNTTLVGVVIVAITLAFAVPAGYALARLSGRWGQSLGVGIFLTYLVPPTLLFLPLSRVIAEVGLQDNLVSLMLVYPSFTIPFATWLLIGFFKTIPRELEDAAQVDGASRLGTLWRIILPVSIPGILTVVIFTFSLAFNEFVYALTFISSSDTKTVAIGVPTELIRGDVFFWQGLLAAALIPSIPIALLYNVFLDRFIQGFTGGALR